MSYTLRPQVSASRADAGAKEGPEHPRRDLGAEQVEQARARARSERAWALGGQALSSIAIQGMYIAHR